MTTKDDKALIEFMRGFMGNDFSEDDVEYIISYIRAHDAQPEYGPAMLTNGNPPEGAKVEHKGEDYTVYRMPVKHTQLWGYLSGDLTWENLEPAVKHAKGRPVYELIRGKQVSP